MARERGPLLRLVAAILIAPPASILVVAMVATYPYLADGLLLASPGTALAYPVMLLLGLPLHMMLTHWKVRGALIYCGLGAASGFIVMFALAAVVDPEVGLAVNVGVIAGALCALLFWLIRRPDRDAANLPTSAQ
jgi:hypothetical protein